MTSHTGKQIIIIHILPNITRNTSNLSMKIGRIEYENIFLKNYIQNIVEKVVPDFFPVL